MKNHGSLGRLAPRIACAWLSLGCWASGTAQPTGYELALVDLEGNKEVLATLAGTVFAPRVSPEGSRVVYETIDVSEDAVSSRLWVAELADLDAARALPVAGGPINWAGVWMADGERLVFVASGGGSDALYVRRADGSGEAVRLIDGRAPEVQLPGTSRLTFLTRGPDEDYGIGTVDVATADVAALIDRPGSAEHSSHVSPDGRWIAYASNETGRYEVWVEPLPPTGARHRVTQDGGAHPLWSRDGTAIFFDVEHRMFEVDVSVGEQFSVGEPRPLPIAGFEQGEYRRQFDLLPDGSRFLLLFAVD